MRNFYSYFYGIARFGQLLKFLQTWPKENRWHTDGLVRSKCHDYEDIAACHAVGCVFHPHCGSMDSVSSCTLWHYRTDWFWSDWGDTPSLSSRDNSHNGIQGHSHRCRSLFLACCPKSGTIHGLSIHIRVVCACSLANCESTRTLLACGSSSDN